MSLQQQQMNKQYLPIGSLFGIMMPITIMNPNMYMDNQITNDNKHFVHSKLFKQHSYHRSTSFYHRSTSFYHRSTSFHNKQKNGNKIRTNYKILND